MINRAVRTALDSVTLADMIRPLANVAPVEISIPVGAIQKSVKSY